MNPIPFCKYHGTGNDFILIDNRGGSFRKDEAIIAHACSRRFGVGSDGLILIESEEGMDFQMLFFNPDATPSFCGNGSRCAVMMAQELGIIQDSAVFNAYDGTHSAEILGDKVRVKMSDVIPPAPMLHGFLVDTGAPHYIETVDNVKDLIISEIGKDRRFDPVFGEYGVNANFFTETRKGSIFVRTYERGVEGETLSCGTGVTAAAIAYGLTTGIQHVQVETRGGEIEVQFKTTDEGVKDVYLTGPAVKVFEGVLTI